MSDRPFTSARSSRSNPAGSPLDRVPSWQCFLGSPLSDGITGKLISAIWDPWRELPRHLDDLNRTDIYTLRRIVPRDRGMAWGNGLNIASSAAGLIGQKRAQALARSRLVACADIDLVRAERCAQVAQAAVASSSTGVEAVHEE